jgi:hypothetical protein
MGIAQGRVEKLDEAINRLDTNLAGWCLPFAPALAILDPIPGVNQRIAPILVAEIGLGRGREDKLVQRLGKLGYVVEVGAAEPAA